MSALWLAALALAVGYALGRVRPVHRAETWARWKFYTGARRRAARYVAVYLIAVLHPFRHRRVWLYGVVFLGTLGRVKLYQPAAAMTPASVHTGPDGGEAA